MQMSPKHVFCFYLSTWWCPFFRLIFFICCQFLGLPNLLLERVYLYLVAVGKNLETNYSQAQIICPFQTYDQRIQWFHLGQMSCDPVDELSIKTHAWNGGKNISWKKMSVEVEKKDWGHTARNDSYIILAKALSASIST